MDNDFFRLFFIVIIVISVTGCTDNIPIIGKDPIEGSWTYDESSSTKLTFVDDGTGYYYYNKGNGISGTWKKISKDTYVFEFRGPSFLGQTTSAIELKYDPNSDTLYIEGFKDRTYSRFK